MAERVVPRALARTGWRKSSYSGAEGGSCLEVLDGHPAGVPVRDSKDPHGPAVVFPVAAWRAFIGAVKDSPTV
ncbi:DUF397 domain-containing protein [Streptomyces lydicus]|nr:DUF397 domain-containing protein [Streptomyces lydicus]MDC7337779.1 DUF397 domain-containing protein [Streptomyces lydicus]UEG92821.1 DUF397 domain-containing protein [Streptomyces lydicus]